MQGQKVKVKGLELLVHPRPLPPLETTRLQSRVGRLPRDERGERRRQRDGTAPSVDNVGLPRSPHSCTDSSTAYTSLLRLALPTSDKPDPHDLSRVPSRHSMRSVRTVNTLNPTLPAGAEKMLENLRPKGADDEDEEGEDEAEGSRPQFVVGDEDKAETEHQETGQGRASLDDKNKGWREASAV